MQRRALDYVDDTLVPVGGVPDSGSDGREDGVFLVTDLPESAPLAANDFPVLSRNVKDQLSFDQKCKSFDSLLVSCVLPTRSP